MGVAVESKYILSRFAYCHTVGGQLVLESPLSQAQVQILHWKGAALINELARPHTCGELEAQIAGIASETIQQFVSLLLSAQMLSEIPPNDNDPEQASDIFAQWDFHDLLFQVLSALAPAGG